MPNSRYFILLAWLLLLLPPGPAAAAPKAAATRPTAKSAALDADYVPALAAADRFLEAWSIDDIEIGMSLLTSRAKEKISETEIEAFFSSPTPSAYEIDRGKLLRRGAYEFPVVLAGPAAGNSRARRRFSTLLVVRTGNNEWAVDKLP